MVLVLRPRDTSFGLQVLCINQVMITFVAGVQGAGLLKGT